MCWPDAPSMCRGPPPPRPHPSPGLYPMTDWYGDLSQQISYQMKQGLTGAKGNCHTAFQSWLRTSTVARAQNLGSEFLLELRRRRICARGHIHRPSSELGAFSVTFPSWWEMRLGLPVVKMGLRVTKLGHLFTGQQNLTFWNKSMFCDKMLTLAVHICSVNKYGHLVQLLI